MTERMAALLSSISLLSLLLSGIAVAAPASLLQPQLLDTESYGETFTATVELSNGAAILTQLLFTNAGFGDGKLACRLLIVPVRGRGHNEAIRFDRDEWRRAQGGVTAGERCVLTRGNGRVNFQVSGVRGPSNWIPSKIPCRNQVSHYFWLSNEARLGQT